MHEQITRSGRTGCNEQGYDCGSGFWRPV